MLRATVVIRGALVAGALFGGACSGSVAQTVSEAPVESTPTTAPADPTAAPPTAVPPTPVPTVLIAPTTAPIGAAEAAAAKPTATALLSATPTTSTAQPVPPRCLRVVDFAAPETNWFIVNDGVMGGLSDGTGEIANGLLLFSGTINTNGGGFSSVRSAAAGNDFLGAESLRIRLQTSRARTYEFIIEVDNEELPRRVSYFGQIATDGGPDPQEVEVALEAFEPRIFGSPVTAPTIVPEQINSIGIILADGIDGEFALAVEWIDACDRLAS